MTPPSPAVQRMLAYGIVAAILGLGIWALSLPIRSVGALKAEIAETRALRDGYLARAADRQALVERHGHLTANAANDPSYLSSSTPAVAGAALQRRIADLIEARGGVLESAQVLAVQPMDMFDRIGLTIRFRTEMDDLIAVLHTIETGPPALVVDAIDIRTGDADATMPTGGPITLSVTLDLSGFRPREAEDGQLADGMERTR